jgi:hypothetical protein
MHIRARADDWHSGNPNVRPALWFGMLIGALAVGIAAAALAGSLVNGNGSPFLG